jgi:hypothetical protein
VTAPEEPSLPEPPRRQPTRELLLAQALDACIKAERRVPGSADEIIAHQPEWARRDLQRLIGLADSLDAAATNAIMSEDFREAARMRLMQRIMADSGVEPVTLPGARLVAVRSRNGQHRTKGRKTRARWLWRGSASVLAAALGITATLTASASALPGEALYGLKQAQEELSLRLAADDQARALALLRRADARLDETARLLLQGRTDEAQLTTQLYDQVVVRATTTFVVTVDDQPSDASAGAHMDSRLSQQQEQLQTMIQSAPEPARADLREALVATERSRALVADPRPVERALGRGAGGERPAVAAVAPAVAAEDLPTPAPAPRRPLQVVSTPRTEVVAVVQSDDDAAARPVDPPSDSEEETRVASPAQTTARGNSGGRGSAAALPPATRSTQNSGAATPDKPAAEQRDTSDDQLVHQPQPAIAARDEGSDTPRNLTNANLQPAVRPSGATTRTEQGDDVPVPGNGRGAPMPQTPPVVAHTPLAPIVTAPEERGGNVAAERPGGAAGRATSGQTAVPKGDDTTARDSAAETKAGGKTPPTVTGQAQPAATPATARRSGSDGDKPASAPTPAAAQNRGGESDKPASNPPPNRIGADSVKPSGNPPPNRGGGGGSPGGTGGGDHGH